MSLLRRGRGGGSRVETPRTDTQKELQWTAKHRQTVGGGGGQACSTPAALYWAHLRALLPKHAAPGGLRRAGSG